MAATAALVFIPLWLVGAEINMYVGVKRAGYPVADEAPVFLVVFAIPAAAIFTWWRLRRWHWTDDGCWRRWS